ncbi:protein phosphatase 2C domain-containing protein [Isoptericola chiayiensis]|uniref:Protein phosphatase 2C domain-containing protein n=1 Tax=Isoptericola chiayiensis TaxID=579446 RepID=A0ABP8YH63_9MICO|nr:protein phosphatase [Isoptericola chiayiensis]
MSLALRYAARSDVGLVRSDNQDSAYAGPNLLVVADGMGGHAGGDIASALAIAALAPLDTPEHGPEQALSDLEHTVEQARQDLVDASEADPELAGMGTTVTALLRSGNTLAMAHLGDSRAYLLRDQVLNQVTVDHTFVQHLVDTGRISPDEAETHPQRNVVMRVLGDFDVDLTPDMSIREARAGDRWLLCSDGLSGFVPIEQITQVLVECDSPDEAADLLITLAMTAGSTDNITVVVADVVDVEADDAAAASQVVGAAATHDAPAPTHRDDTATHDEAPAPAREDDDEEDEDDDVRPAPRRRPWIGVLVAILVLGGLGYGGWWAYGWTQDQYYVGVADGEVAVFQGIPQDAGPLTLSHPVDWTGTAVDELPAYWVDRLDGTIRASSESEARARADALIDEALPTPTPTPTPSPSPSTSPSPAPSPTPTGRGGDGGGAGSEEAQA